MLHASSTGDGGEGAASGIGGSGRRDRVGGGTCRLQDLCLKDPMVDERVSPVALRGSTRWRSSRPVRLTESLKKELQTFSPPGRILGRDRLPEPQVPGVCEPDEIVGSGT